MTGPSEEAMASMRQNIREKVRAEILEEMVAQQVQFQARVVAQMQAKFNEMTAKFMADMFARNMNPSDLTLPSSTGQVPNAESSRHLNAKSLCRLNIGSNEDRDHVDVDQDV